MITKYCCVCGSEKELNIHHFVPISLGGKDHKKNKITLCSKHHNFIHKMETKLNINYLIKLSKEKMKKKNEFIGGKPPFGYNLIRTGKIIKAGRGRKKNLLILKRNEKQMSIIRQMKLLKDQGNTYRSIATQLNKNTNKNFDCGWVFRILKRYENVN
jgi:hypothetical protein